MAKKKNIKLTEHISYCIIDSTIYLFQNNINLSEDEIEILYKKLTLIIEDNGISYINISASKIEDRKEMYQKLGFSLSYYDVNKLNVLYDGKKNKKDYRCYGIMTKKDFFDKINNKEDNTEKHDRVIIIYSFCLEVLCFFVIYVYKGLFIWLNRMEECL